MKGMRKRLAMFVFMLASVAGILAVAPATKTSAATTYKKKLELGQEYTKYDITGDKKADKICINPKVKDAWYNQGLVIKINGVKYNIPCPEKYDYFYYTDIDLIRLKNGKTFLHVGTRYEDSDDPYQSIYEFTGSKMKNVLNLKKLTGKYGFHINTSVTKVKDNTITVKQTSQVPRLSHIEFSYSYKYSKGRWVLTSNVANISKYMFDTNYRALKKNVTWYTGKGCTKKKSSSLKKGTKAKPVQIYLKSNGFAIKLKTKSGKTGWIKGGKKIDSNAIIFEGASFAG